MKRIEVKNLKKQFNTIEAVKGINFQINQKEILFQNLSSKFLKLTHQIEDDLTNNIEDIDFNENNEIVHDDYLVSKEQKLCIIPPIGGG